MIWESKTWFVRKTLSQFCYLHQWYLRSRKIFEYSRFHCRESWIFKLYSEHWRNYCFNWVFMKTVMKFLWNFWNKKRVSGERKGLMFIKVRKNNQNYLQSSRRKVWQQRHQKGKMFSWMSFMLSFGRWYGRKGFR